MRRKSLSVLFICCLVASFACSAYAKTLYDDFSTEYLKKGSWLDMAIGPFGFNEFVREVDGGVLVSKVGTNEYIDWARNRLYFSNPAAMTTIRTDVTVNAINSGPGDEGAAFARISGYYYKKDTGTQGTDNGDIWAEICVGDRGSGLEAWYEVEEVISGNDFNSLVNTVMATGLTIGTAYTIELTYNGTNGFSFSIRQGGNPIASASFNGPTRLEGSFLPFKTLATCIHEGDVDFGNGFIAAQFDNVWVNGALYETFSGSRIDTNNWDVREMERTRESIAGKGRLNIAGTYAWGRAQTSNNLSLRDKYTPYLEATVRVESASVISTGASGIARIGGYFYNEQPGAANNINNVWGDLRLILDDSGNLTAQAMVWRSDSVDETTGTFLAPLHTFSTAVGVDQDHALSINFTGTSLEFSCDGELWTYTIATDVYDPYMSYRDLTTRVYHTAVGQGGYVMARFDDVYVADPDFTSLTSDWIETSSNHWDNGCPRTPYTQTVSMTQSGCDLEVLNPEGNISRGVLSGSTFLTFSAFEGAPSEWVSVTIEGTMTDATAGSGTVNYMTTSGCGGGFDIEIRKASPGSIQFSSAVYTVSEDGTTATISVTRTGGSDGEVSVDFTTSDGTATAGSDYTATSGTLDWADSDGATKSILVDITNDVTDEPNETVNLVLSNISGNAILGSQDTAQLTIVDDDSPGEIQFSAATYSVDESDTTATITVTRTGGSAGAVSADCAASDGTASTGSDYTAAGGTMNWPDGDDTDKTFTVSIIDDGDDESDETINLDLSNITGGAILGTPSSAVLTVNDNDGSGSTGGGGGGGGCFIQSLLQ